MNPPDDEEYDGPPDDTTPPQESAMPAPEPANEEDLEVPEEVVADLRTREPAALRVLPREEPIQRTPPQDLEAEAALLGCLLLWPDDCTGVLGAVEPQDFYREDHRLVAEELLQALEDGRPHDGVSLASALARKSHLHVTVARDLLARLMDAAPTGAHVAYHAAAVREKALRRRVIQHGSGLVEAGFAHPLDEALRETADGARALVEASATARDELLSASSIRDMELPALVPIVGGELFAKGYYLLVSGPPKLGKSVITLDLAIKVAEGDQTWLGLEVSGPLRVLILSAEGGIRLLQKRLRLAASNVKPEVLERIAAPRELARMKFSRPADIQRLRDMIRRHRADIVIIDPLIRFSGAKERDEDEVEKVCEAMAHVRDDLGVAMVLVHHTRKRQGNGKDRDATDSADARGSGVWASEADLCLTLEKDAKDRTGKRALTTWESRWEATPERQVITIEEGLYVDVAVLANQDPTGFSRDPGAGGSVDPQKAVACCVEHDAEGGATYEDLEKATGKGFETLRKYLRKAGPKLGLASTKAGTGTPVRWKKVAP